MSRNVSCQQFPCWDKWIQSRRPRRTDQTHLKSYNHSNLLTFSTFPNLFDPPMQLYLISPGWILREWALRREDDDSHCYSRPHYHSYCWKHHISRGCCPQIEIKRNAFKSGNICFIFLSKIVIFWDFPYSMVFLFPLGQFPDTRDLRSLSAWNGTSWEAKSISFY